MKNITKLSLIAAAVGAIGTSAVFAGDSLLIDRLLRERLAADNNRQTSVAVFKQQQGLGQRADQGIRPELRFEWHSNGKGGGQGYGLYVPVK